MKKLEDLKSDLLSDKVDKFYVFFGDDYGIRKHYINKLSSYFMQVNYLDSWESVKEVISVKGLFDIKQLIVIYGDVSFAKQSKEVIEKFINKVNDNKHTCVFIYDKNNFKNTLQATDETILATELFSSFDEYITDFQAVQDKIAQEFVESELISLDNDSVMELARNCNNLYNNILLEADKIKCYEQQKGISQQSAYNDLLNKNQLLYEQEEFSTIEFMNALLTNNRNKLAYWCDILQNDNIALNKFFSGITYIFYDFLIAGLITTYGKYDGSSKAYNYGLPWGRAKYIRELNLEFDNTYYFDCAFKVSEIDELIKSGKLLKEDILNYFLVNVI